MKASVALFRLYTGHNRLAVHLQRLSPDLNSTMDTVHLLQHQTIPKINSDINSQLSIIDLQEPEQPTNQPYSECKLLKILKALLEVRWNAIPVIRKFL
jgi:hypothetical protein